MLQRCAKLEHAVAVVFERRLNFSAQKIACGPVRTESMKRRAEDGRTIYTYTYTYIARIAVPFMWGSLRFAPIMMYVFGVADYESDIIFKRLNTLIVAPHAGYSFPADSFLVR